MHSVACEAIERQLGSRFHPNGWWRGSRVGAGCLAMNEHGDVFDYLVVGAGTAGCVLASRLSEDRSQRVALIEAGPMDRHLFIHIPAAVAAAIARPHLNWRFMTVPQSHLGGRQIPIPRGRVVGGSGSINGMVYF